MKRTPPKIVSDYRRRFYRGDLSVDDLREVMVIENLRLTDAPKSLNGRWMDVEGFGKVIFSGLHKSSLTRQSTDQLTKHISNPDDCRHDAANGEFNLYDYTVDILVMNPEGDLYEDFADHSYYEKNPDRLKPNTILALKVVE